MFDRLKTKNKTIGMKQTLKAIESGKAEIVYLASDADEHVLLKIKELCQRKAVEIVNVETMKQLGKACGIEVGAAAVCILKVESRK